MKEEQMNRPAAHRRVRRAVCAALLVVGVAMALPASAASAHGGQGNATPGNEGSHPWPTNGCSTPVKSINSVRGIYNFGHACVHHDGCYGGFKAANGRPTYWVSRYQCDAWFYYDMAASCRWQHGSDPSKSWAGRQCMQWAANYYGAVRTFGRGYYEGPTNN